MADYRLGRWPERIMIGDHSYRIAFVDVVKFLQLANMLEREACMPERAAPVACPSYHEHIAIHERQA
ncbi:MAG: hypothetical protein U0796_16380 [Gemmatales bacterium]